jgi:hypothetical protein
VPRRPLSGLLTHLLLFSSRIALSTATCPPEIIQTSVAEMPANEREGVEEPTMLCAGGAEMDGCETAVRIHGECRTNVELQ